MLRLMLCKESLERWCRLIFTTLGFHWDDLRAVLDHEIDLTALVRIVARSHIELATKLLQHIVLRQRAFELVV